METLRCFVCGYEMGNIDEGGNQPSGGLAFASPGHYGTSVFDPMDGTFLEINVCDACLVTRGKQDLVRRGESRTKTSTKYTVWNP